MKSVALYLVIGSFIAILTSCGGDTSKNNDTNGEASVEETDTIAPGIYLEGMYATSTRFPQGQYNLENIFDDNPETYWSTAQGAGPDEGVVLYFPKKLYISELQLIPATDVSLAVIKKVSIYADGHRLGDFDPANPVKINSDLTSLFIKIGDTDKTTTDEVSSEDYEHEMSLERFDSKFSVGLSGVKIFNADGEIQIIPPVTVKGSVIASSVLQPANAYAADQLFDSRKEFVWAEGAKGSGENEKLTFNFEDSQNISSIKLWNGYQRSQKHFESNARIKTFELGLKNGTKTKYSMKDSMEPQTISLVGPLNGKEIELTVLEVYPGKNYKDLVVSEILFFDESRPIIIKDDKTEETAKSFIAETTGSVLETYVDKRLHNETVYPSYTSNKSLILRSNKTFVLYDHTVSSDDAKQEDKEVVADGNWEILEQKEGYAKIRIFGKLFNLSETVEYYKGNTSTEFIKIFQDNLHITAEEVKGEKFIDAFYNKLPDAL